VNTKICIIVTIHQIHQYIDNHNSSSDQQAISCCSQTQMPLN